MRYTLLSCFLLILSNLTVSGQSGPQSIRDSYDFPVPPETDISLFYLQRSQNANTIQYDVNLNGKGRIDSSEPIKVYWLRYETTGHKKDLKWVERKWAYGIKSKKLNTDTYEVKLVAYDKRPILVHQDLSGEVEAKMKINGKMVRFKSIFIDMIENGMFPKIKTIELFGEDPYTKEAVYEKFKPKD